MPGVNCWGMTMRVEKISAVTFRVLNMRASVRFYRDVLGMEVSTEGKMRFSLRFAPRTQLPYPQSRARSFGSWLGADDFLRGGCGCILGIPAGQRI